MKALRGIENTARTLAGQRANLVFYQRVPCQGRVLKHEVESAGVAYAFRRGTMPVGVPRQFVKSLLDHGWGDGEVLLAIRQRTTSAQIKTAFRQALRNGVATQEAFSQQGIVARSTFVKSLLIASYGAYEELRVIDPQYGVENLSYYLLRTTDFVDARVFNPNLASLPKLKHILANEAFDLIGLCPIVLENDVEVMAMADELGKGALRVAGGPVFHNMPPDVFLKSFPADVVVRGPGELPLARIAERLLGREGTPLNLLQDQPGLWIYDNWIPIARMSHSKNRIFTMAQPI